MFVILALAHLALTGLALQRVGLTLGTALVLGLLALAGSGCLLPVHLSQRELTAAVQPANFLPRFEGETVYAVNLGGALIPIGVAIHLLLVAPPPLMLIPAALLVAVVCYRLNRPPPRAGAGIGLIAAVLLAALLGTVLAPAASASFAYICGTFGVLIGADLLHLPAAGRARLSVVAVGAAGAFDDLYLVGILAALMT